LQFVNFMFECRSRYFTFDAVFNHISLLLYGTRHFNSIPHFTLSSVHSASRRHRRDEMLRLIPSPDDIRTAWRGRYEEHHYKKYGGVSTAKSDRQLNRIYSQLNYVLFWICQTSIPCLLQGGYEEKG
jgi:hypothetical protein